MSRPWTTVPTAACEPERSHGITGAGDNGHDEDLESWFTPVKVTVPGLDTSGEEFVGIGEACQTSTEVCGYGFAYFHGGTMTAELEKVQCAGGTIQSKEKDIVLADGVDSTTYTATVLDTAFDTPIAGWDVKFITDFGSLDTTGGVKAVEKKTGADGKTSVTITSPTAGGADLTAIDRQRTVATEEIYFTDYQAKSKVIEPTVRAGDRATAKVQVWWENIKTGARIMWSKNKSYFEFGHDKFDVYANAKAVDGTSIVAKTNEAADDGDFTEMYTGTDASITDKYDTIEFAIPAKDVMPHSWNEVERLRLESAGQRFALLSGKVSGKVWVGKIFYDKFEIKAAPTCVGVDFVKESTLMAEGTQMLSGLSLTGEKFTPGIGAPDYTDRIKIYLGDITTGDRTKKLNDLGEAIVGKDGTLLPVLVGDDCIKQLSPGFYDITVDGLVFKNGLEIKNLFGMASIQIRLGTKVGGIYYLNPSKKYSVNVNAFGAESVAAWAGSAKLAETGYTGMFVLDAFKLRDFLSTFTAKSMWRTPDNRTYTTVVSTQLYRQNSLGYSTVSFNAKGRTFTVAGIARGYAEANGSKLFKMTIVLQQKVGGKWKNVKSTSTRTASNGKYKASIKANKAGTYRVMVYHTDVAHLKAVKYSKTKTVK